jgi:hypothetical protein
MHAGNNEPIHSDEEQVKTGHMVEAVEEPLT